MAYRIQGAGCRVQDAGARRVGNVEGMRGIVRKHDCALPAQYTSHSNARGHSLVSRKLRGLSALGESPKRGEFAAGVWPGGVQLWE